ncbi:MAG: hypothetical protein ABGZ23_13500 [Fuerstiella sp.]|nr:hypothetical protein [Fuerstiella sp.]
MKPQFTLFAVFVATTLQCLPAAAQSTGTTARDAQKAQSVRIGIQPVVEGQNVATVLVARTLMNKREQRQSVVHRHGRIILNFGINYSGWRKPWMKRTYEHLLQKNMVRESSTAGPDDDVHGVLVPPPTPISLLTE